MSNLKVPAIIAPNMDDKLNAELTRNSSTQLQLGQRDNTNGTVIVNTKIIDLSTAKTLTLGSSIAALIETGTPSASTLYNIYLSASGVLGLSATAPDDDGYRTSDSNNRFFGAVYLDSSKECAKVWNLCGFGSSVVFLALTSGISRTSGSSIYYPVVTMSNVVCLAGTIAKSSATVYGKQSAGNYLQIVITTGGTGVAYYRGYAVAGLHLSYDTQVKAVATSISQTDYAVEYFYPGSNTTNIDIIGNSPELILERCTL